MSPERTRTDTSVQPNRPTEAISPCPHQTYELACAGVYPAMAVPAEPIAASRIEARMTPKTLLVVSPASVANR